MLLATLVALQVSKVARHAKYFANNFSTFRKINHKTLKKKKLIADFNISFYI